MRKGIILAGGSGTRLYPVTRVMSKQLLPVYDKPMIFYPLSTLMLAGIRDILIISTPRDLPHFSELLGDGSNLGMTLNYCEQKEPRGLAEAFILGADFIGRDSACLILGDNIFYGHSLPELLRAASSDEKVARIFAYWVADPERYGVVEFANGKAERIQEKPIAPNSHYAVPGIYFYPNDVITRAKTLKPSRRGELEITDLNNIYLHLGELRVDMMGRGVAWLDTGTHESLLDASNFIENLQKRQGLRIACLEEIAFRMGYIDEEQLVRLASEAQASSYKEYLFMTLSELSTDENSSYRAAGSSSN